MIRATLTALALMAIFAATAHASEATKVIDGTCGGAPSAIGDLASAIKKANRDCLPENSLQRPGAEDAELNGLKNSYHAWIKQECARQTCMSNLWGFLEYDHNYDFYEKNVLAGCGEWASRSAAALTKSAPKYWSVREVEYGRDPKYGSFDRYHWAVELQNTRTGEIVTVDGYRAAAKARSWVFWSPASTNDASISKADETGPESDETSKWGAPSKGGCENTSTLCNPKPCKI